LALVKPQRILRPLVEILVRLALQLTLNRYARLPNAGAGGHERITRRCLNESIPSFSLDSLACRELDKCELLDGCVEESSYEARELVLRVKGVGPSLKVKCGNPVHMMRPFHFSPEKVHRNPAK